MSDETRNDMEDCEYRSQWGTPDLSGYPITRPVANINAPVNGPVSQSTDNSTNKPLPWVALASLFGGLGFGVALLLAMIGPQFMRSEVRAGQNQLRAEFSQQIADAKAEAKAARTDAAIAKDWTDQRNAELKVLRGNK